MAWLRAHVGEWISIRAHAERAPLRFTLTLTLGELPEGWTRARGHARTWAGIVGLICITPFVLLLAATLLRSVGLGAINLWRITHVGFQRRSGAVEGLVALEFAPLHLIVVLAAVVVGGLFFGHLAADSYACLHGVRSAC